MEEPKKICGLQLKEEYLKYGSYTWLMYKVSSPMFNWEISDVNIVRLIYLSTFLSYKDNIVEYHGSPITTKNLYDILGITKRTAYNFISECIKANLMSVDEEKIIHLCSSFSRIAYLKRKIPPEYSVIRLYHDGIQKLYRTYGIDSPKKLACLFTIIPWVNKETNVVSINPLETDRLRVGALKFSAVCKITGHNPDNKHRIISYLDELKTPMWDAVHLKERGKHKITVVNPRVYYGGTNSVAPEVIGVFQNGDIYGQ